MKNLLLLLMLGVSASGCASGRAQTPEDQPTLVVPPVPPRAIETQPLIEPPVVEPVPDLPPPPANAPRPRPSPNRTAEAKPDPKSETPPDVAAASTPNPAPVPPLRTPTAPSGAEAARQIRDILERANNALAKVDYQRLSADRKANYNTAKNYMDQATEALKKEDLTLARSFAERAENIAKQLESGR